jgi:hypothetical protein
MAVVELTGEVGVVAQVVEDDEPTEHSSIPRAFGNRRKPRTERRSGRIPPRCSPMIRRLESSTVPGHRLHLGPVSVVGEPTWRDITEGDGPLTLAKPDGVGALQFSCALYKSGPEPNASLEDLKSMVLEFGESTVSVSRRILRRIMQRAAMQSAVSRWRTISSEPGTSPMGTVSAW